MLFPIAPSTEPAREKAASSPPTMIESAAFFAPSEPPETGASSMSTPPWARRSANSWAFSGLSVEQSIKSDPSASPSARPSSPKRTSSTWGESVRHATTMSDARPTSAGVAARVAPSATTSSARLAVRFHTVTANPARARLEAMKRPMVPRPTKPTRSAALLGDSLTRDP